MLRHIPCIVIVFNFCTVFGILAEEKPIDPALLEKNGIVRLDGKHLTLFSDMKDKRGSIDQLVLDESVTIFDAAAPLVADFFNVNVGRHENWRVRAVLIENFDTFKPTGLVDEVPKLNNGYALKNNLWIRQQKNDYYRRHLLLHEEVHVWMESVFQSWGPPWYREGVAELLATHRYQDGELTLNVFPDHPKNFPFWGRIEIVQNAVENGKFLPVDEVLNLEPTDYNETEAYAWSWAFAAFYSNHPKYAGVAQKMPPFLKLDKNEFKKKFIEQIETKNSWHEFQNDWSDFATNLVYGYDFERTVISDYAVGKKLSPKKPKELSVTSEKGWQNSGIDVESGKRYRITATGRFQLAQEPTAWWSEANGVTLRYYRGIPIGTLLVAVLPEQSAIQTNSPEGVGFLSPKPIGTHFTGAVPQSGTLFFRINDFPSELRDNKGTIAVTVEEIDGR